MRFVWISLWALGCAGGVDNDENAPGLCDNYAVVGASPADGAGDVYVGAGRGVAVTFEGSPALPFFTVTDEDGEKVQGRASNEGDVWTWVPYEAFASDTTYDVKVRAAEQCAAERITTFTTGGYAPPANPADLAGETYVFDFSKAKTSTTAGIFELENILALWVGEADETGMSVTVIPTYDGEQETCSPTVAAGRATLDGAYLQVPPFTMPVVASGMVMWLVEVEVGGLYEGGTSLSHVTMSGQLDAAGIMDCDLMSAIGTPCVACSDGKGDTCVDFSVSNGAMHLDGELQPKVVTEAMIDADIEC